MKENRLVVGSASWADTIPEWLLEEVKAERMINGLISLMKGGEHKVGDAEVCVYLLTASLASPMSSEFTQIYLYTATKLMTKRGMQVPEDVRVNELSEYETQELNDLKRRIYTSRGGDISHPLFEALKHLKRQNGKKQSKEEQVKEKGVITLLNYAEMSK